MTIVPREYSFEVHTHQTVDSVVTELDMNTDNRTFRNVFLGFSDRTFYGEVYHSGFDIKESVGCHTTGMIPVFHGVFEERDDGILIHVRVSNARVLFSALWMLVISAGCFSKGLSLLFQSDLSGTILLSIAIFALCMNQGIGWFYQRKVRDGEKLLRELFMNSKTPMATSRRRGGTN